MSVEQMGQDPREELFPGSASIPESTVLVLTPLKDASASVAPYVQLLKTLTFPYSQITLGFLESDSRDGTFEHIQAALAALRVEFGGAEIWKRDFGYVVPDGTNRWDPQIQRERRSVLARSRNHLISHALTDEEWVLWLDVDVSFFPPDIIERLIATGKNIVQPHCVLDFGGTTFDQNAWRDKGRFHLDDLRDEGAQVPLDAVGGTMLLVRADLHRNGLIFPPFPYRPGHPKAREGEGELETEGLGLMAADMGETCWGLPGVEILHRRS
ncbi:MAG TPA: glycosyltransferase [Nitrolancea sp.]|nr:glycosyltransferase [Nitrolancea sp.]